MVSLHFTKMKLIEITETDSPGVQLELGGAAAALAALLAHELGVGGVLDVVMG